MKNLIVSASPKVKAITLPAKPEVVAPPDVDPRVQIVRVAVEAALHAIRAVLPDPALQKGRTVVELGPQATQAFPTWTFWGVTHVLLENLAPVVTTMGFQAGAGHEDAFLAPTGAIGSIKDVARQWAGIWVHVTNTSQDPASLVRVSVW